MAEGTTRKPFWKTMKEKVLHLSEKEENKAEDETPGDIPESEASQFNGLVFQLLSELKIKKTYPPQDLSTVLFDLLSNGEETVSVESLWKAIETTGLRRNDPRLESCRLKFEEKRKALKVESGGFKVNKADFSECVGGATPLLGKAFKNDMVIPEFRTFVKKIEEIYKRCKSNKSGKLADYIPILALANPNHFAVSICTVDGQRHSFGDANVKFCLQSCSKPLNYSVAISDLSAKEVHKYVGQEPSGRSFNKIALDKNMKPHNPMINAGAIMICSLCKRGGDLDKRFEQVQSHYRKLAGGEFIGYDDETFISERETADRNYALAYYMRENKGFPEGTDLMETCDLYFKLCSVEATAESASVIAATLANGGICPITGEKVLNGEAVKHSLSLMYSCGMYDYSGQFAFKVGLPAKSGVAGAVLLVIPNVMGICVWSPPLDELGNSCRGVQFCKELVETFNFHNYDSLIHRESKIDPRKKTIEERDESTAVIELMYAVTKGDINAISNYLLSGGDLTQADYNGRTALHQACAEGHTEIVRLLVNQLNVPHNPKDRWGFTPLDEAKRFNRTEIVKLLSELPTPEPTPILTVLTEIKNGKNGVSVKEQNGVKKNPSNGDESGKLAEDNNKDEHSKK